jgi:hypothetical protein
MSSTRSILRRVAVLLGLVGAGCDSPSASGGTLAGFQVQGDGQGGHAGVELPQPIQVTALDTDGQPLKGVEVQFVVTSGGGSLLVAQARTNADGIVQNRWTLGTVAGDSQRVEVRASHPAAAAPRTYAVLRAVARAGTPSAIQVLPGHPDVPDAPYFGPAFEETIVAPAVRLVDAYGNPVPGATVTWHVLKGGGEFPVTQTVSGPDGVARTTWRLAPLEGVQWLRVAINTIKVEIPGLAVSKPNVDLQMTGSVPQTSTPGSVHAFRFRLMAKPANGGQPIPGARMTFIAVGGVEDPAQAVTDAQGYVHVRWHMPNADPGYELLFNVKVYEDTYHVFRTRITP